jgi:hypothetical protein
MKHFIGVAVLVALALVARFGVFQRIFLGYMHRASIPVGTIIFWLLMGLAAVWFVPGGNLGGTTEGTQTSISIFGLQYNFTTEQFSFQPSKNSS